jgi:Plasmid recombination enzyme
MANFVSLHIEKCKPNSCGLGRHNRRDDIPENADPEKQHLNRILVDHGDNVMTAIEKRIKEGRTDNQKEIRKDAVKCIELVLSGSPEVMQNMSVDTLADWTRENRAFLEEEYGKENIVSLMLHRDETTPHIHAMIVPITIEKKRFDQNKKEVKVGTAGRLSAKEVMGSRSDMRDLQTRYAERMNRFGLVRGIEGSRATHQAVQSHYRVVNTKIEPEKFEIQKEGKIFKTDESAESAIKRVMEEVVKPLKAQVQKLENDHGEGRVNALFREIEKQKKIIETVTKEKERYREIRNEFHSALKDIAKEAVSLERLREWLLERDLIGSKELKDALDEKDRVVIKQVIKGRT